MAVLYEIVPELQLLYYAGFGHCRGAELFAAEQAARQDPRRRPGMAIIVDVQDVTALDIDVDDFQRGIEMNAHLVAHDQELERTAFVVRQPLDELAASAYEAVAGPVVPIRMGVFQGVASALGWLGLSEHEARLHDLKQALRARFWAIQGG